MQKTLPGVGQWTLPFEQLPVEGELEAFGGFDDAEFEGAAEGAADEGAPDGAADGAADGTPEGAADCEPAGYDGAALPDGATLALIVEMVVTVAIPLGPGAAKEPL
jgi:hypothetical protein